MLEEIGFQLTRCPCSAALCPSSLVDGPLSMVRRPWSVVRSQSEERGWGLEQFSILDIESQAAASGQFTIQNCPSPRCPRFMVLAS
jgi:hypothetical protein